MGISLNEIADSDRGAVIRSVLGIVKNSGGLDEYLTQFASMPRESVTNRILEKRKLRVVLM